MSFAVTLKALLKARRMSTAKLASLVGVRPQAVSQWTGGKTNPVGKRLERIARALGVTVSDLMDDSPNPPLKGEFIEALDELALLRWWRGLSPAERRLVRRLMEPPWPPGDAS
jgi:transcriptional regulator with XRE-family HTH domain